MPSSSALPGELGGQHTVVNFGSQIAPQAPASGPALATPNTNISTDDWVVKIAEVMGEQFVLKPKQQTYMYRPPYPPSCDLIPMSSRYRPREFTKFTGQDNTTTVEHISRFLVQCGEARATKALKIRLFPLSLSGLAFWWFASLPPNSIIT